MILESYSKLIVLKKLGSDKTRHILVECMCDCGNIIITTLTRLKNGKTKSCGCLRRKKRGKYNPKLYKNLL